MRYTHDFGTPLSAGWSELTENRRYWDEFVDRFGFRPGLDASLWPAITEPVPSLTFDLRASGLTAGEVFARFDAVNAEALRCFVTQFADDPTFVVLDWQHPGYRFDAAEHAAAADARWRVPVYPDGDYYIFLREDLGEGTFGHPWEHTLCVFGERLISSLGRTLASWLPVVRVDGQPVP
ncbi:hypothetical protein ABH922_002115 [Rhodococcus sp. 27YEA15]|uniref:DUF2716 domain-containing protein n=1 Tax=Rhodococcus sp. 27YEA15 TaxID=3156259 RepID=UPI003C7A7C58